MKIPPKVKAWLVDVAERVGSSFGEAIVAAVAAGALAKGVNATTAHVLLVAGLTAAAATLKGILAAAVKGSVSPASLAPRLRRPPSRSSLASLTVHVTADTSQAKAAIAELASDAKRLRRRYRQIPHGSVVVDSRSVPQTARDRLSLLPKPSGRKHGAIPSPRDDRDYQAKLPSPAKIPASVNYGAGLTFAMLLNNALGTCYEAALLHALQVLTGYTPVDADALAVYEQVTGYDPTRTDANGNNPTDRGTAGRSLFDWARKQGLIDNYAAVPTDRASVKAAIVARKAVLCEWALPVGAENEGARWTMPRAGKTAGSWGYHATVEVGYTPRHNDNVTWGEEGTVTPPFEDAYLQAAWVITVKPGTDVAAIMAKVRAA